MIISCLILNKASAQDMIYLSGGTKIPGKISEIASDKVKFKNLANPTGPIYSRNTNNVEVAFNDAGDYLVFAQTKALTDQEKNDFINSVAKPRPYDILVDLDGNVLPATISDESDTELLASSGGKELKVEKSTLAFIIRKNGTHLLIGNAEQDLPYLSLDKAKINDLLSQANVANAKPVNRSVATVKETSVKEAPLTNKSDELNLDFAQFGNKALQKTKEFTDYLQSIVSVKTNREAANKSINLACGLFLNENALVEVSNTGSKAKNKYKIRGYLNRLEVKSGQYDNVQIEYANINYASKFTKGTDGNYYGVVTFIQKFQGFVDGNLVYGDVTKRNVTIVLKHYEKAVDGESVSGWDVFLDDVGVVETKKL